MNLVGLTGKIVTELETKIIKVTDPKTKVIKTHKLTKFNVMITKSGREDGEVSNGFFEIEAWDNNSEFANKCFKRGMLISVKGILIQNRYKVDNKTRSQVLIRAESFNFVPVVSEVTDNLGYNEDYNRNTNDENEEKAAVDRAMMATGNYDRTPGISLGYD